MTNESATDAALLAATASGDEAAFNLLVRRHIRSATLLAAQLLGDRDDAEDIVQEAFIVVHRDARTFVMLGIAYERRSGLSHEMTRTDSHRLVMVQLTKELGLDSTQDAAIRTILARHQGALDSTWHRMQPHVRATLHSTHQEILGILRPDQAATYRKMVENLHTRPTGNRRHRLPTPIAEASSMTHASHQPQTHTAKGHDGMNHYPRLYVMTALSFIAMYGLMYAMVDASSNVYNSLNQVYMAALMTAAMVIIELAVMRPMYQDERLNVALMAGSAVLLALCWFGIRRQAGIGDGQFVRSMIPHHAGAILMCEQAPITDAELRQLCQGIIKGQQAEIDQMKAKLEALR